jgi:Cu2+-exporting ATPase
MHVQILSGDRTEPVADVARCLGITDWQSALKPGEKVVILEALRKHGRQVLMVGDGINDAAALAAASVSLSPISAADISKAQADAVFLGDSLRSVATVIETSRRAKSLMHQNLWLAVIYNALAVPLAIVGLVTPLIAAAAMSGSSVIVTLNALRLALRKTARLAKAAKMQVAEAT